MNDALAVVAIKWCAAISAALLLTNCAPADGVEKEFDEEAVREQIRKGGVDEKPAGAVAIGDHLYVAPVAIDEEGCELFREWSDLGLVRQVIYFRDGEGSFSIIKSEDGSCNARIVETGVDDEGCPKFEAHQPDGAVTDVIYYAYPGGGYTTVRERSVCKEAS